ncbi:MAG TPA: hypothetical protein VIB62_11190 [Actinomycetota bacterium]
MRKPVAIGALASLLLATVLTLGVPAVALHADWVRHTGKALDGVAVGPDGSVYVVGTRRRSITVEAVLIKYRPNGSRVWTRSWLPDPHASTNGIAVDVAPDGRIAWIGRVQGQCEGSGWFLETVRPNGELQQRYVTPGWECSIAQAATDVAISNSAIVVTGIHFGCCANPLRNGWVRGFSRDAAPMWQTDFEPPAGTPRGWFDRATSVDIAANGAIYAGGWAATEFVEDEAFAIDGTPVLNKLRADGSRIYRRRVHVQMQALDAPVLVALAAGRVLLATSVRGGGVEWFRSNGTAGWLGSLSTGGTLRWSRTWDASGDEAAGPEGLAVGPTGTIWVVGTRRDTAHHDLDLFVRRYEPNGHFVEANDRDGGVRNLLGTGVGLGDPGERYVTGTVGYRNGGKQGRLWRFGA